MKNRHVVLTSRPDSIAEAENFSIRKGPVPEPSDDEILVRNQFLG
jgi:NADPH-dependent curcumin reductase CurA